MTIEQQVKTAAAYAGMSQAALARSMNTTPSNFNQKLKRGTFTKEELLQIANALGADFIFRFEFPDGTKI